MGLAGRGLRALDRGRARNCLCNFGNFRGFRWLKKRGASLNPTKVPLQQEVEQVRLPGGAPQSPTPELPPDGRVAKPAPPTSRGNATFTGPHQPGRCDHSL